MNPPTLRRNPTQNLPLPQQPRDNPEAKFYIPEVTEDTGTVLNLVYDIRTNLDNLVFTFVSDLCGMLCGVNSSPEEMDLTPDIRQNLDVNPHGFTR